MNDKEWMDDQINKWKEFIESDKGKEYLENVKRRQAFLAEWKSKKLSWFDSIGPEKRAYYIEKIINKYNSDSYKDRWYNRGYFPPETLYDLIYDYAYEYGKCWNAIYEEAISGFDHKFVFDDWKIVLYTGQGSVIRIDKVTEEDLKKGPDEWAQRCLGHEYETAFD